jgi:hypothetical protein
MDAQTFGRPVRAVVQVQCATELECLVRQAKQFSPQNVQPLPSCYDTIHCDQARLQPQPLSALASNMSAQQFT